MFIRENKIVSCHQNDLVKIQEVRDYPWGIGWEHIYTSPTHHDVFPQNFGNKSKFKRLPRHNDLPKLNNFFFIRYSFPLALI